MKRLEIQIGKTNQILRAVSQTVRKEEFRNYVKLADDMVRYVKNPDHGGVGIAAPQIGVNKRIIALTLLKTYDDESAPTIAMFNPRITSMSDACETDNEGCLSVPGETGDVARASEIRVEYQDRTGTDKSMIFKGLTARIVQHEVDHLDGILFTDRLLEKAPLATRSDTQKSASVPK